MRQQLLVLAALFASASAGGPLNGRDPHGYKLTAETTAQPDNAAAQAYEKEFYADVTKEAGIHNKSLKARQEKHLDRHEEKLAKATAAADLQEEVVDHEKSLEMQADYKHLHLG